MDRVQNFERVALQMTAADSDGLHRSAALVQILGDDCG